MLCAVTSILPVNEDPLLWDLEKCSSLYVGQTNIFYLFFEFISFIRIMVIRFLNVN